MTGKNSCHFESGLSRSLPRLPRVRGLREEIPRIAQIDLTTRNNLKIEGLARVIANLSKEELKILEARLSKKNDVLKRRLNDVKNKKVKLQLKSVI